MSTRFEKHRMPRIRYSLSTLLWLMFCAGTIMLGVQRKSWEAWCVVARIKAEVADFGIPSFSRVNGMSVDTSTDHRPGVPSEFYKSGFVPNSPYVYLANGYTGPARDPFNQRNETCGVRLFNRNTGVEIAKLANPDDWRVDSVQVTTDGTRILIISSKGASVWDVATRTLIRSFEGARRYLDDGSSSYSNQISSGAISADGRRVALDDDDSQNITVFDVDSGSVLSKTSFFHRYSSYTLNPQLSGDGAYMLLFRQHNVWDNSTGRNNVESSLVSIVETRTGRAILADESPSGGHVSAAVMTADGTAMLADWNEREKSVRVRAFDCRRETMNVREWRIDEAKDEVYFLHGGKWLACRKKDSLDIYDATTGRLIHSRPKRLESFDLYWHLAADGSRMICPSGDGLRVWDIGKNRFTERYKDPGDEVGFCSTRSIDPFASGQDKQWGDLANRPSATDNHEAESDALVEPVPTGLRIWRRQRPEAWWGVLLFPEVILSMLLFAALVWRVVAMARHAAKREIRPRWYRFLTAIGGAFIRVSWSAWACGVATGVSAFFLWQHWGPYELAREWPSEDIVQSSENSPLLVEGNRHGRTRVWDRETAQLTQEFSVPVDEANFNTERSNNSFGFSNPFDANPIQPYRLQNGVLIVDQKSIWDIRTGQCVASFDTSGAIADFDDSEHYTWVNENNCALLFDYDSRTIVASLPGYSLSENIHLWHLALLEGKNDCCLFDIDQLKTIAKLKRVSGDSHLSVYRSRDGNPILEKDGSVNFATNTDTGQNRQTLDRAQLPDLAAREKRSMRPAQDEATLSFKSEGGVATLRDDSRCLYDEFPGNPLELSPDRHYAFVQAPTDKLLQWNVDERKWVRSVAEFTENTDLDLKFLNAGQWLAVEAQSNYPKREDKAVFVFDIETGEPIFSLQRPDASFNLVEGPISSPNFLIATSRPVPNMGYSDSVIQLWKLSRPATLWGVLSLPWLWSMIGCAGAFVWRLILARRTSNAFA